MSDCYTVPNAWRARCGGRVELAQRVVGIFVDQVAKDLPQLEDSIRGGNPEEATKVAHRIKGASANVCAEDLRADAEIVEQLAREERLDETPAPLARLEADLQSYMELTESFLS